MLAVVTGGGAGMGRELCKQLIGLGCKVATCDVNEDKLAETVTECNSISLQADIFVFKADVSSEEQCIAFKDSTLAHFKSDHINLLFNNAGISGGGSFVVAPRADWEACFNVNWFGVYYMARAFMPSLLASKSGHITNTSSVNGFWASIGPQTAHTAYSASKFAVKGFTEALVTDLRLNAPHIGVSLVCPGHIGTDIVANSQQKAKGIYGKVFFVGMKKRILSREEVPQEMKDFVESADDEQMEAVMRTMAQQFRDGGMSASDAATYILNAVQAGQWRVLVGNDAEELDKQVRANPEAAYSVEFSQKLMEMIGSKSEDGGNSNLVAQEAALAQLEAARTSRL
jgi:NAD(P)-dependent dehydrogenase (short-subunit alcohol dehydrogenase family)